MHSKDTVIKQLQSEVALKDEEYMELMVRQQKDVQLILKEMKEKSKQLSAAYEAHVKTIEASFVSERAELIKKN